MTIPLCCIDATAALAAIQESTAEAAAPEPEPADTFTAEDVLDLLRSACMHFDPEHAEAYRHMDAEHVRRAVRFNARLLEAHREYQRVHRITRRGRRNHANAIYRWLDVVPRQYAIIASAWALLPTTLLDPPAPERANAHAATDAPRG